jgi:TetR/AcrR family transcriptional regulator, tetracycline repressor protein
MAKIRREEAISEALNLLNEVGLDGVTTRRLAQRLGVESATLYWHFRNKTELLDEMASAVLARHYTHPLPESKDAWPLWLADNTRGFRHALLAYRDGARLHAGTAPSADRINRIAMKVDYLVRAGLPEPEAAMTLYSLGQFALGCVLEEQADLNRITAEPEDTPVEATLSGQALQLVAVVEKPSGETAFEFGLSMLIAGLVKKTEDRLGPHKPFRRDRGQSR